MRVYPLKITKTNFCIFYIFITAAKGRYGHLQMISACPRDPNFNKPNYSNLKPYLTYSQLYANQIQAPRCRCRGVVVVAIYNSIRCHIYVDQQQQQQQHQQQQQQQQQQLSFVVAAAVATAAATASVAVAAQLLRMKMMISSYSSSAVADSSFQMRFKVLSHRRVLL